jgi:pimeloyl-ACP methyl ester carboxylesterase
MRLLLITAQGHCNMRIDKVNDNNRLKMRKYILIALVILLNKTVVLAAVQQDSSFTESDIVLQTSSGQIFGTLTVPQHITHKIPVALVIAGSGPTDRNGNSAAGLKTNAYQQLAHALTTRQIASLRFDKRGIAASAAAMKKETDVRFEDYIKDAEGWIDLLKKDQRFSSVVIIGHSEGSLIGMIAARKADKYISIAGAGQPADQILKKQLAAQSAKLGDSATLLLDSLKAGKMVRPLNFVLMLLFRPSVQPYLISWFKYDPQEEIKKLNIPTLIIQGTSDIQVSTEDAKRLKAAQPKAPLVLINDMNHTLKKITGGMEQNRQSYRDPSLPVDEELVASITDFINRN